MLYVAQPKPRGCRTSYGKRFDTLEEAKKHALKRTNADRKYFIIRRSNEYSTPVIVGNTEWMHENEELSYSYYKSWML